MTLNVGTQLGSFEITGLLGKGGMGEVYRATDTKLGREVAIKTLPATLADDADRLSRFEREAKLLATLNHAHIAAVHSLDETDGTLYIAMELVEGESLEARLKTGPIPLEEALTYGLQIASALEAAHEKGVVHRDLKPANIMLTSEGMIKVLDFGLAKAFAGNPNEASPAHSPALSVAMTQQGLVLGTAGYMSPEQASGQATDQRADVWAFGVVMYEMLTGQPVFSGESVPHILADVLKTTPDWTRLPALHPRLKLMLERCLEKKPRERYHAIADARADLEHALADPSGAKVAPGDAALATEPRSLLPWAAATVVLAALAAAAAWFAKPEPPLQVSRWAHVIPDDVEFGPGNGRNMIGISPDGTTIAFTTTRNIYLRSIDALGSRPIAGTENCGAACSEPTFSPDGQWLVYRDGIVGGLAKIPVIGGTPVSLVTDVPAGAGAGLSWGSDDSIRYGALDGIYRVPADGGEPELVVSAESLGTAIAAPQLLDNGAILFSTLGQGIAVQPPDFDTPPFALFPGTFAKYVETGHIVYKNGDTLFAVPFDVDALEVTGGPVPVVPQVLGGRFSISASGSLAYQPGTLEQAVTTTELTLVDRTGQQTPLAVASRSYHNPRISPDGARLAVEASGTDDSTDIWVYELDGRTQMRQLAAEGNNTRPMWTPDGEQLTFTSDRDGWSRIYLQSADLSGTAVALTPAEFSNVPLVAESWTPDGRTLAFSQMGTPPRSLWTVTFDGNGEPGEPVRFAGGETDGDAFSGAFSPDGNWLVYMRVLGVGNEQLFMEPFPPNGTRFQLTQTSGSNPLWSPGGTELFYRYGQQTLLGAGGEPPRPPELFSIEITLDPAPRFSTERALPIENFSVSGREYDITPDGERFIVVFPERSSSSDEIPRNQIYVVQNWLEELR
jgi:Tol biopolymer transport system component